MTTKLFVTTILNSKYESSKLQTCFMPIDEKPLDTRLLDFSVHDLYEKMIT